MRRVRPVVLALVATCCAACAANASSTPPRTASGTTAAPPSAAPTSSPPASSPLTSASSRRPSPSHPPSAAQTKAAQAIARLADGLGYSVAMVDVSTGSAFATGATKGMYEGSIAKLDIAETLMLAHQHSHSALSSSERDLAEDMIEHSDNHAADTLWTRLGGRSAVGKANKTLGLHHTTLGPGILWGFSTTSASDQVTLLRALVSTHSPLTASSRSYVVGLMRDVESDQRWGVATLADHPSRTALKNGWLPNSLDDGRWLVNSLGIVVRDGHTYLMAVLTQHGASFAGGIHLTEQLARAALPAVR